jgi:Domain of unknown function (DUF4145)
LYAYGDERYRYAVSLYFIIRFSIYYYFGKFSIKRFMRLYSRPGGLQESLHIEFACGLLKCLPMQNPSSLENPNLLEPEGQTGSVAVSHAVTLRCPHCRGVGAFAPVHQNANITYNKRLTAPSNSTIALTASLRQCPNPVCRGIALVVQQSTGALLVVLPPQRLDFSLDNLPATCQETLKEAVACHAAGAYRAAAIMVRRLLEEVCADNNAQGPNLHQRLQALKGNVVLPHALFDAMGELKALGNDAAHVEATAYDDIGREEAADSIELAKEILKALYQLKGLVARLQARKGATTPP